MRRPHIRWRERTLDYIDTEIYPLRPSFAKGAGFTKFCGDIEPLLHHGSIENTVFKLVQMHPSRLVIRALGRSPDFDSSTLHDLISRNLMFRPEYCDISTPEIEKRGGTVVCQIALKPFNDDEKRAEFRRIISNALEARLPDEFSVLLGGTTTIDIQKRGVDKQKAVRFLLKAKGFDASSMVYFGNEFTQFGNDRCVAELPDGERPAVIINVGKWPEKSDPIRQRLINDGNGPQGTANYLEFLLHQLG